MSPQEKVLLYYINAHTTQSGAYVVGRNDIARLLNVSVITAAKRMENLVSMGYVDVQKKPLARGTGYKWIYYITRHGVNNTQAMWQEALELYREHCNKRLLDAMLEARAISKPRGKAKKVSKNQLKLEL